MAFQKASKKAARLRLALVGPSGSGKTYSALRIARGLVGPAGRIAVADTERGSASKYADAFQFDAQDMETFSPQDYINVIQEAERGGYDVLILDSLSHAWMGKGGALEMVDAAAKRSKSGNSFNAWREVTPAHNAMVDAILRARCHIIVTMRVKTEYVPEKDERTGKTTPRKVGLAPVQRDGLEYEFDVVLDLDNTEGVVSKTRCSALAKAVIPEPGEKLGETLRAWLTDGPTAESSGERRAPAKAAAREAREPVDARTAAALDDPNGPAAHSYLGEDLVGFGKHKAIRRADATEAQLREALAEGEALLADPRPLHHAPELKRRMEALHRELMLREQVPAQASAAVVAFGPRRGVRVADLSDADLSTTIDLANEKLMEQPKAKWAKAMRENLALLEAEVELRCRQRVTGPREPGSDG